MLTDSTSPAQKPFRGRPYGVLPGHRRIGHDDDGRRRFRNPGVATDQSGRVGQFGENRDKAVTRGFEHGDSKGLKHTARFRVGTRFPYYALAYE